MKAIALTLLLSVVTHCAVAADAAFNCVIASDRTTYSVGEVPHITIHITNNTTKNVVLVGSLDGSTTDRRFPKCRFEIRDAAGQAVTVPLVLCGNMNGPRTNDFVMVPAGGTFNPFGTGFFAPHQFHQFPVTVPGTYTLRFSYTTSDRVQDYFGDERMMGRTKVARDIQRLVNRVPKLDLKSNELQLIFTAQPK